MSTTDDTNAARRGSGSNDLLGLLARLQSLKVLLGTDSPEVRGWAPVVQQGAQATVNAAIAALKKCGGDNCMGRRCDDVTNWVTAQAAQARVAAERERCAAWVEARRDAFCEEHGSIDPDTGALEFGRGPHADAKSEYVGELEEIAAGLRALKA